MDAAEVKANQHKVWSAAAPGWRKHDSSLQKYAAPVTERMVAGLKPGQQVLDVASGTGEPALSAVARVAPGGSVVGVDFVEEMLAFAREKAVQRGLSNIEFRVMDAEQLDFAPATFDAVTFRWGLMFMPDPVGCLRRLHRALKPGGTLTLTCWATLDKNPWVAIPLRVMQRVLELPDPPAGAPGGFAFADPARLRSTIIDAGFNDLHVEPVELVMADFATGAELVEYVAAIAGSLAILFKRLTPEQLPQVKAEMAKDAEQAGGGRARLKGVTWLATATR
jgi:SAM-dependent methyltransferase